MMPTAANHTEDPARSRDLARLRELTDPHLPYPNAPIDPALAHRDLNQRAEVIAILGQARRRAKARRVRAQAVLILRA